MIVAPSAAQQHAAQTYADGRFKDLITAGKPVNLCALPDQTFALLLAQIELDSEEEGLVEAFSTETLVVIAIKRLIANITIELATRERKRKLH